MTTVLVGRIPPIRGFEHQLQTQTGIDRTSDEDFVRNGMGLFNGDFIRDSVLPNSTESLIQERYYLQN